MTRVLIASFAAKDARLALVGGKGANLVRLAQAGLSVPDGFLITTHAYRAYVAEHDLWPVIEEQLASIQPDDPGGLSIASERIRAAFSRGALPAQLAEAILTAYHGLGNGSDEPVAVRSSATAEDLPDLSFAGQQDTFLNVIGEEALLEAVVNCWSSLWTARAIGYRNRNGIPHREVALAVVVQQMVPSEASGVLFTANPLNGRRTEMVIDATFGLGEALVSGQVEPDHYVVDAASGRILEKRLGAKALVIQGREGGGTTTLAAEAADRQALADEAIAELAAIGRDIDTLFSSPQDVEWAWANSRLYILQSRPITSLFPIPHQAEEADELKVMFSFGAVQGMLDPMTPLGRNTIASLFAGAAGLFGYQVTAETQNVMWQAGERLWVNLTPLLRHPLGRQIVRRALGSLEPSVAQAMEALWEDPRLAARGGRLSPYLLRRLLPLLLPATGRLLLTLWRPDQRRVLLQRRIQRLLDRFEGRSHAAHRLGARLDLFDEAFRIAVPSILPHLVPTIGGGMFSLALLTRLARHLSAGQGDVLLLTRGLPHNVTTEMDLALWQTARIIRADADATACFAAHDAAVLAADYQAGRLPSEAQMAVAHFLARYGMRGVGEIDMGRKRWREDPAPVMATLQSYLRIEAPEAAPDAVFERGAVAARAALDRLVAAARQTRLGWLKARFIRVIARRLRALAGLRESPKFTIIRLMGIIRQGLLESGQELVAAGLLSEPDDLFFLHLDELRALARLASEDANSAEGEVLAQGEKRNWRGLVAERRAAYQREKGRRQIPRLLLGDGTAYYEGLGANGAVDGVITGSPVSPGVVEGAVHVVLDPRGARLAPGEILVCPGTDPAWTPLFLAAGGLVMEVGGLMTHGSVVAREYGIPAVVGVHLATTRLKTGQRVRVDGTAGQVVVLD